MKEGEWSDWQALRFPMKPGLGEFSAICRLYLRKAHPFLELYVSPLDFDPAEAAAKISTPASYARNLARDLGRFYTQGMPEDTSALSAGVLSDDEFRQQSTFVLEESMRLLRHELGRFRDGFLFSYFSTLDLNSHAFWRCIDPDHPSYTAALAARHGDFLPWLYGRMDDAVGLALERADDDTMVVVLSDHGFTSFRRQFNLNSWLMDQGYATPRTGAERGETEMFGDALWDGTRAYGLGMNSLYVNLRGREPGGIVAPGDEADRLKDELIERLTAVRDPKNGERAIAAVYRPERLYSGPRLDRAPDLIVGYNPYYRASWETVLGKYPREVFADNRSPWSGDHCMDSRFLSGVLFANRRLASEGAALWDMAPSILSYFGAPVPRVMKGHSVLT